MLSISRLAKWEKVSEILKLRAEFTKRKRRSIAELTNALICMVKLFSPYSTGLRSEEEFFLFAVFRNAF